MAEQRIDTQQWLLDLQAALRALWPDRKVVTFPGAPPLPDGPEMTQEELNQLTRVAHAIAHAREEAVSALTGATVADLLEQGRQKGLQEAQDSFGRRDA